MAFSIKVKNVGVTGTIGVWQRINLNEQTELLNQIMEAGAVKTLTALDSPPKEFAWEHYATNLVGQGTYGEGDTIEVGS